jgi:peptidoglycan/xylan/chitin deacetylase (PgdA/CDA1 family)
MKLQQHGRYDYSAINTRPNYYWPDGKRLAVYIAVNIEHFSFGEGLGHTPTHLGPQPDVRNFSWRDYGLRVGIWRIFDLLDELGIPASHLMNSTIYDYAPQIPERIRQRGDELLGHGRTNTERQGDYPEGQERELIQEATEAFRQNEGKTPDGWMGPWISESLITPDLLREEGYLFVMDWSCDDQPIWMKTRSGPLLSIPYHIEINDSPAQLTRFQTAEEFTDMTIGHFDEMLRQSKDQPLVFSLALHSFVVGQPYRLAGLRNILTHIVEHPDAEKIWLTRPGEIFDHVSSLPPGTVPGDKRS